MVISARSTGLAVLGALLWQTPAWSQDVPLDITEPWVMPFDVSQRYSDDIPGLIEDQDQIYEFMWRTFVALNWPQLADGARAEPDTAASLAPWGAGAFSDGPVVWESYRRPSQVFTKPKEWPIAWNDPTEPVCPLVDNTEPMVISSFSTNYSSNSDGVNQPFTQANYPTGPVADQNGNYLRYEVGLNQSYFTYIGHFRYFRPRVQRRAVQSTSPTCVSTVKRLPPPTSATRSIFRSCPRAWRAISMAWPTTPGRASSSGRRPGKSWMATTCRSASIAARPTS